MWRRGSRLTLSPSGRRLHHDDRLEAADVGLDTEIGLLRMPLGVEDVHLIDIAGGDAQLGGLGVEVD